MFAFHLMLDYRFITYFTINTCYLLTISHTWWRPNTLNWWCHEIFALSHIGSNRVYLRNEGGNYCGCNSYLICISIPYQPGHTPVPLLIEPTIVSDGAPPITKINASTLLINWLSQLIHTPFSNWKWMQRDRTLHLYHRWALKTKGSFYYHWKELSSRREIHFINCLSSRRLSCGYAITIKLVFALGLGLGVWFVVFVDTWFGYSSWHISLYNSKKR